MREALLYSAKFPDLQQQYTRRTPRSINFSPHVQHEDVRKVFCGSILYNTIPNPAAARAIKPEPISRLAAPLSEEPVSELLSIPVPEAKPV